jgi:uncharacterized protein YjbI with pentapeptide repeats
MINTATLIRAISSLALPTVAIIAARNRRETTDSEHSDADTEGLPGLTRLALLDLVDDGATLTGLSVRLQRLDGIGLRGLDLRACDFTSTSLRRADLRGALLDGASFRGADLAGANLTGASLGGTDLLEANLRKADLTAANLSGARGLENAHIQRARYDRATKWPRGFDPVAAGAART